MKTKVPSNEDTGHFARDPVMGLGNNGSIVELRSNVPSRFAAGMTTMKSFSQFWFDKTKSKSNIRSGRSSISFRKKLALDRQQTSRESYNNIILSTSDNQMNTIWDPILNIVSKTKIQDHFRPITAISPLIKTSRNPVKIHHHKIMSKSLLSLIEKDSHLASRQNMSVNEELSLKSRGNESGRISQIHNNKSLLFDVDLFGEENNSDFEERDKDDIQKAFNKLASIARRNLIQLSKINSPTFESLIDKYKGLEILKRNTLQIDQITELNEDNPIKPKSSNKEYIK